MTTGRRKTNEPNTGQQHPAEIARMMLPGSRLFEDRKPTKSKMSIESSKQFAPLAGQPTTTNNNHRSYPKRHQRTFARASIVSLIVIIGLTFIGRTAVADSKTNSAPTNGTSTVNNSNSTSPAGHARRATKQGAQAAPSDSSAVLGKTGHKVTTQAFEPQSSELSSMYVRIPIAEPLEATASASSSANALPDANQQQQTVEEGDTPSDSSKATTWTGPWPKKFQIGYIKQSDLHQVLIESLKNDPFLGTKKTTSSPNGKTTSPTLMPSTLTTKSGSSAVPTTQGPGGTKSETLPAPQAPPSDASSLMQSYPKPKTVQQTSAPLSRPNQYQNHQAVQRQRPQPSHQYQWPSMNTYGRLASPQVQPRPGNLMNAYAKSQQQPMGLLQHHQQPHQQLRNIHHVGQQHQQGGTFRHLGRQPRLHQPTAFAPSAHLQHQQHGFKYGLAPMAIQMPPAYHQANLQQQQQQQLQFAGSPPLTSQPVYSINSFPAGHQQQNQQQTIDSEPMELIQLSSPLGSQKTKSDYYLSSWRPVQTTNDDIAATKQQQISPNEFGADNGFDEVFGGPPSADQKSMNRHPVLSNYLQTGGASTDSSTAKTSPAKMFKQQKQATKGGSDTKTSEASKGFDPESVQQRMEGTKSETGRRALPADNNGNSTTTTTAPDSTTTSSPSSTDDQANGGASTSTQATPTTTSGGTNQTTVGSVETTTEPESEVFESDSTEPADGGDEATTTSAPSTTTDSMSASGARSTSVAPTLQTPSSSTPSSVQQVSSDGAEAEVVTQGQQSGGKTQFPGLSQSSDESTTASSVGQSTTGSSREETTPSNSVMSSGGTGSTEVEGSSSTTPAADAMASAAKTDASMSDEALMAAAVRASEVSKSRVASSQRQRQTKANNNNNNSQTSGSKKARSSDRIVQVSQPASPSSGRKSVGQTQQSASGNNKLITRKPGLGQRAGKQISGVKGATPLASGKVVAANSLAGDTKSAAQKSAAAASKKKSTTKATNAKPASAAPKSQKFTRMVSGEPGSSQMVSMTAAQAQSAAQTLASLLLSRCLSSSNCSHLLDVCSTKQAAVPFGPNGISSQATTTTGAPTSTSGLPASATDLAGTGINASIAAAWSMPVGLVSTSLMGLMQALQADKALQLFPAWREAVESVMDQGAQAGYTLIMPSNEAIDRLALAQVEALLANSDQMSQLIENHIVDSAETIDLSSSAKPSSTTAASLATLRNRHQTRYIKSKGLQINQHRDRMVTINGKRVVYANQPVPGGRVHVIDGLLDSANQPLGLAGASNAPTIANNRLPDIMDTLRQCDKFDGFVTLAEGTGLTQILKQDEPLTVFVPSNEALRRIPDDELEVIKNNSTALREFIMYHIVNGSYFSQDLRDGQQLASILDMRPIQVGVRVDGCSRRLVEANTSPMRRPDIVAKNGVIHILDWYLTTRDNEWCDPIGRSAASERVQQSASEQVVASVAAASDNAAASAYNTPSTGVGSNGGYATRMTSLPANHKPGVAPIMNDMDTAASSSLIKPTKITSLIGEQSADGSLVSALPSSSVIVEAIQ